MEAAHRVNPFLNFTWDQRKIETTYCQHQIIPSPLGMQLYETLDVTSPALGTDLYTNHLSILISPELCFVGKQVNIYVKAMHLH